MAGAKTIRRSPDTSRMAHAVSRPGIDPRINLSWAEVTDLGFDPAQGVFADIQLNPSGEHETVYVNCPYAGDGFGDWCPLHVGDLVLIAFPNGDPNNGGVILARGWNGVDKPPAVIANPTGDEPVNDRVIVVEPGQKLTVVVSMGGSIELKNDSASVVIEGTDILAGDATAMPLVLADPYNQLLAALNVFATALNALPLGPLSAVAAAGTTLMGSLKALPPPATLILKGS
jgi:hypothetical protein